MAPDGRRRLDAKDIAAIDAEAYEEPGRDLLATRPAAEGGDVDNPIADVGVPGSVGKTERKIGSDENNVLAKGKDS